MKKCGVLTPQLLAGSEGETRSLYLDILGRLGRIKGVEFFCRA